MEKVVGIDVSKDWLDAHLPAIVERVVAQEVARITGQESV